MKKHWIRIFALLLACGIMLSAAPAALAEDEGTAVAISTGVTEKPSAEIKASWDDAWFTKNADVYQHDLALTAMALSAAAYAKTEEGVSSGASVKKTLEAFGFEQVKSYNYEFSAESSSRTAYTFGVKSVKDKDGKAVKLVAIVIRGTGVYTEWAGNLNVGSGSEHAGFIQARDELMGNLKKYLPAAGVSGRAKFLVTGHSRGAATANLTAARLVDQEMAKKLDVYGYTFATPAVSTEAKTEGYENIFNLIHEEDLVTLVPLAKWKYCRYGIDRPLFDKDAEDYEARFAAMNEQYKALTGQDYAVYQDAETLDKLTKTIYQMAPTVSGPNMAMLSALLRGDMEGLQELIGGNRVAALLMGRTAVKASSELKPLLQQEHPALVSAHCMAGYYSWLAVEPQA